MVIISLQSIYHIIVIGSVLCGAAYRLGFEMGKHTKK